MRILGIETSCDETSVAIVEDGTKIISNVVFSQERLHRPFKGIVPEIASRAHLETINWVVEKAIIEAGRSLGFRELSLEKKISISQLSTLNSQLLADAIAVTVGPGLVGSLLVGKMTAEALGWLLDLPVVGVNHLESHLFANLLEDASLSPPFLGLIVSGGHTDLVLVQGFGQYKVLGRTRDDAVGECFDKVANILNLGYPGGPLIDKIAKQGDAKAVRFPRPYLYGSWDFSFSGLKTAVLYYWQKKSLEFRELGLKIKDKRQKTLVSQLSPLSEASRRDNSQLISDICASFQAAVVDVIVAKTIRAAKKFKLKKIVIGGGVSANAALRRRFLSEGKKNGLKIYLPSKEICTDNAAMVAAVGYYKLRQRESLFRELSSEKKSSNSQLSTSLIVDPCLPIENWE